MLCDGETRVDAPASDRGWAEVAESIEQLNPQRVECRSGDGKLLRAKPFSYFFPEANEASAEPPAFVPTTPEQASLQQFATLLAQAHSSPVMQHALELIDRQAAQCTRLEADNARLRELVAKLRAELAQANAELATPPAGGGDDLVGGIMQGIAAASQAAEVTPISKGKKS